MILTLAARLGCLALAVADRLSRRRPDDLCAIVDATREPSPEGLALIRQAWDDLDAALAAASCTCADLLWTDDQLVEYAPDLAELDAVTTYDDVTYLWGIK